jgi:hypothetical protein
MFWSPTVDLQPRDCLLLSRIYGAQKHFDTRMPDLSDHLLIHSATTYRSILLWYTVKVKEGGRKEEMAKE